MNKALAKQTARPTELVTVKNLSTYYGASHILQDVSFCVAAGESIGLMGRNGMGKSTLLKSIMGLIKPPYGRVVGQVVVKGSDMSNAAPYQLAQMGLAYVPEGRGIFSNLSVLENLVMAACVGSSDAAKARAKAGQEWHLDKVLGAFPRLKERLHHGGQQLSGGEQQMLSIGRALMTNPDILLLDEATEGLAPLMAREIWRICSLIRKSGISSVIVDKNWRHVTQITDRQLILVKGQVVFDGATASLLAQPALLAEHLGI